MEKKQRSDNYHDAYEWLVDRANRFAHNPEELVSMIEALGGRCSNEDLEDLFQDEITQDGYWVKPREPSVDDINKLLELGWQFAEQMDQLVLLPGPNSREQHWACEVKPYPNGIRLPHYWERVVDESCSSTPKSS